MVKKKLCNFFQEKYIISKHDKGTETNQADHIPQWWNKIHNHCNIFGEVENIRLRFHTLAMKVLIVFFLCCKEIPDYRRRFSSGYITELHPRSNRDAHVCLTQDLNKLSLQLISGLIIHHWSCVEPQQQQTGRTQRKHTRFQISRLEITTDIWSFIVLYRENLHWKTKADISS